MVETLLRHHARRVRVHAVWVDPDCCEIDQHPNKRSPLVEDFGRVAEGEDSQMSPHDFHPLPARALDFAYDLWCRYSRP
jgi:hypothetical protein